MAISFPFGLRVFKLWPKVCIYVCWFLFSELLSESFGNSTAVQRPWGARIFPPTPDSNFPHPTERRSDYAKGTEGNSRACQRTALSPFLRLCPHPMPLTLLRWADVSLCECFFPPFGTLFFLSFRFWDWITYLWLPHMLLSFVHFPLLILLDWALRNPKCVPNNWSVQLPRRYFFLDCSFSRSDLQLFPRFAVYIS